MSTLAVVSQSGESLSFFEPEGRKVGQLTELLSEPHELCYDDRTNLLYISHAYSHGWYGAHGDFVQDITVVDCSSRKVVGTIDVSPAGGTHYLALDKKRNMLYASVEDGLADGPNHGGIVGIDLGSRKVVKSIESGHRTHWFVITPDGSKAFTCNKEAKFISVIDLLGEKLIGKIELPGGCEQPGISNDGKLAYFPTPTISVALSDKVATFGIQVVDTATAQIVRTIPLERAAVSIHVDSRDRLLVGQYNVKTLDSGKRVLGDGGLLVLSSAAEDNQRLATIDTGATPLTVFSSPDGKTGYVANISKGTVSVIDMTNFTIQKTLDVDTEPRKDKAFHTGAHGMALIP